MGIRVGPIYLRDAVLLAPMSGVTDLPFRRIARSLGAELLISEMIASREQLHAARTQRRDRRGELDPGLTAVQIAGHDPETMAEAARFNADRGAAIIDINFGCPAKKVVNKLCGSALMQDEGLAGRIVEAVVAAVDIPVTVKMRTGWHDDHRNAPQVARIAEQAGAAMITVHGRTRTQLYTGRADWRFIRRVKDAVSVPVIANGDIVAYDDIDRCLAESGADGVMVGRGAQGRPWFIAQAAAYLRDGQRLDDPPLQARRDVVLQHYDAMLSHYGEAQGVRIARKHLGWYAKGLPGAARFRDEVFALSDPTAVRERVRSAFDQAALSSVVGLAA